MPDYLTVIAKPMDYGAVRAKLHGGDYNVSPSAFASDMRQIFNNALAYNWDAAQECHQSAKQVLINVTLLTHLPTHLPTYPPTHLPTYPPTHLPTYPPTHLQWGCPEGVIRPPNTCSDLT